MQIHSLPAGGAYEQYLNIVSLLAAVNKAALRYEHCFNKH